MTTIGTKLPGYDLEVLACDPLAPIYNELAAKHGVKCPIESIQGFAEDLSCF